MGFILKKAFKNMYLCTAFPTRRTGFSALIITLITFLTNPMCMHTISKFSSLHSTYLFCSSSFANSSNSSGLRFSESDVGEHAGMELTEESPSWEEESGLMAGLAISGSLRVAGMSIKKVFRNSFRKVKVSPERKGGNRIFQSNSPFLLI